MGDLRLYAIGIDEIRGMFGAAPNEAERLRSVATAALAPAGGEQRYGLLGKLGPIFRRVPAAPVVTPTTPSREDLERLLAGHYIPPERTGATWRLLETLVQGTAWSSTGLPLDPRSIDDLDFALARGGVAAAVGVRHLLTSAASLELLPVAGLTVGYHPYDKAVAMAAAYREAMPEIKTDEQRSLVAELVAWLDGFPHWADVAASLRRPAPDLVGFWSG